MYQVWHKECHTLISLRCWRQQAPNGVAYAKPQVIKLRLNSSLGSPQDGILNQSIRHQVVSISEVICLIAPSSLKKVTCNNHPTFCQCNFLSLLPINAFHCVQLLRAPFCLLAGKLVPEIMKPIRSFIFFVIVLCFIYYVLHLIYSNQDILSVKC